MVPFLFYCLERISGVDNLSADHGKQRFQSMNLICGDSEIRLIEHRNIGELASL